MKNTLIILVILIFSSCTNKIDLVGDWKATQLVVNNTDSVEVPIFQPTFFKSDSLVIYFGRLMRYHMKGDSIIFINDIEPTYTPTNLYSSRKTKHTALSTKDKKRFKSKSQRQITYNKIS